MKPFPPFSTRIPALNTHLIQLKYLTYIRPKFYFILTHKYSLNTNYQKLKAQNKISGSLVPLPELEDIPLQRPNLILKSGEKHTKWNDYNIYSSQILNYKELRKLNPCLVTVQNNDGFEYGIALYNPTAISSAQFLCYNVNTIINQSFLESVIKKAMEKRTSILSRIDRLNNYKDIENNNNGYEITSFNKMTPFRMIHSASDNLPGINIDKFQNAFIVTFLNQGSKILAKLIFEAVKTLYDASSVLMKFPNGNKVHDSEDTDIPAFVYGTPINSLDFIENQTHFSIDPKNTTWHLDRRDMRRMIAQYTSSKCVLDLFSHIGGCGIVAATIGKARSVTCIDKSPILCHYGKHSAKLNNLGENIKFVCEDVYNWLKDSTEKFDFVIIDMIENQFNNSKAKQEDQSQELINLIKSTQKVLSKDAHVMFTCGTQFNYNHFLILADQLAYEYQKTITIIQEGGPSLDHPINLSDNLSFPLRWFVIRFEDIY